MIDRNMQLESDGSLTVSAVEDVSGVIETCKSLQSVGLVGSNEMKHAAALPRVVVEDWCQKRGITFADWMRDNKFVREMLNDPNLSSFRIWKGQV